MSEYYTIDDDARRQIINIARRLSYTLDQLTADDRRDYATVLETIARKAKPTEE